jgi:chaperone LolA
MEASRPATREDETIRQLQMKYAQVKTLEADFVQVYRAPGVRMRREEGHVILAQGRKMYWHYTAPEEKFFISDGHTVYLYVPRERQVTKARITEHEDIKAAFAFMLGRLDLRKTFALIERARGETPLEPNNLVLRFIPKDPRLGVAEVVVEVTPDAMRLRRLSLREFDGTRSDFFFSNVRENVAVARSRFVFAIPPGVQVVEAR